MSVEIQRAELNTWGRHEAANSYLVKRRGNKLVAIENPRFYELLEQGAKIVKLSKNNRYKVNETTWAKEVDEVVKLSEGRIQQLKQRINEAGIMRQINAGFSQLFGK